MGITKTTDCTITVDRTEAIDDVRVDGSIHKSELLGCLLDDLAHKPKYVCNTLVVSSGGVVKDAIVMSGGRIEVVDGTIDKVQVTNGGFLCILGGTATNVAECGGCISSASWKKCHIEIEARSHSAYKLSGSVSIHSGNVFKSGCVINGGDVVVLSGGELADYDIYRGRVTADSGGLCHDINVNSGGMFVCNGGSVSNIKVNSGGIFQIAAQNGVLNAKLQNVNITSGGSIFIDKDESLNNIDMSGITCTDGAVAYFTIFDKFGDEQSTAIEIYHNGNLMPEDEYRKLINKSDKEDK